jgi:hypothetical protein
MRHPQFVVRGRLLPRHLEVLPVVLANGAEGLLQEWLAGPMSDRRRKPVTSEYSGKFSNRRLQFELAELTVGA